MESPAPYDPTSPTSIESYGRRLEGHALRDMIAEEAPTTYQAGAGKGNFGEIVERSYFGINPGNASAPDFLAAGVELKTTPLKHSKGRLVAKERLVLQMINYGLVHAESWEKSSLLSKNRLLLLVFYVWEKGVTSIDYVVDTVRLWSFPDEDLEIIRDDWETIVGKILQGRAHEISESDTYYLAACTKGAKGTDRVMQPFSSELAKPRAFALKASYVNSIRRDRSDRQSAISAAELQDGKTFEQLVCERFAGYVGLSASQIAERLGVKASPKAKQFHAEITKRILGVAPDKEVAEFEKADIIVRTVRLRPNGMLKEAVSFKAFDFNDLVLQEWEESEFRSDLERRFLFVVYQFDASGVPVLARAQFWTMPESDVEGPARECFERTVKAIGDGREEDLPRSTANGVCHVRPHGRNASDTLPTPLGSRWTRRSFWLNQKYLSDQLAQR